MHSGGIYLTKKFKLTIILFDCESAVHFIMDEFDDDLLRVEGDDGPSTGLKQKEKKRRISSKYGKSHLLLFFASVYTV